MTEILARVKQALRIMSADFDDEILDLIDACLLDLNAAGVTETDTTNALIIRAVITYCRANFGDADDGEYDRLKASYDEQKAQMSMLTGFTNWLTS